MKKYQEPEIEVIEVEANEPIAAVSGAKEYIPLFGDYGEFPEQI